MDELGFRRAAPSDVPFLIVAVKAAERVRTGEDLSSYEKLFGMSAVEFDTFLARTLPLEGSGHQLTFGTFYVVTRNEEPVGCCSAWVEAANGVASGFKVATALTHFLGSRRWNAGRAGIKAFSGCAPHRTPGALQMETFYVDPGSRGRGITAHLIEAVLSSFRAASLAPEAAEISLLNGNREALRAYEKAGFQLHWKSNTDSPFFEQLTGCSGFLQLRRAL
jgi:ribosomal protein S18 acetylase RimI-like enzyme